MTDQIALTKKLSLDQEHKITGMSSSQFLCLYKLFFLRSKGGWNEIVFIFPTEQEAEEFSSHLFGINVANHFYPGIGSEPYSSIIPSQTNLFARFRTLNAICHNKVRIPIVTSIEALLLQTPPLEFFAEKNLTLKKDDIISPEELATKLVQFGYAKSLSVEEPGTFSNRGEIFDIYPIGKRPFRIYYFDELIEQMYLIDKENLKTLRDQEIQEAKIFKTPYALLEDEKIDIFKNNFPRPIQGERSQHDYRKSVFRKINEKHFFEDYPLFCSFFFEEKSSLMSIISKEYKLVSFNSHQLDDQFIALKEDLNVQYEQFCNDSNDVLKPKPEEMYLLDINPLHKSSILIDDLAFEVNLQENLENEFAINLVSINKSQQGDLHNQQMNYLTSLLQEKSKADYRLYILYKKESSLEEIKYILKTLISENFIQKIRFIECPLDKGFIYESEKILFLSESDFFSRKTTKTKESSINYDSDLFADQLSTLAVGDYVIHKSHGLGKYLGVETLTLNGSTSDYIALEYKDNDKVYVPVYRLNLLQKYSSHESELQVADLKSKKFELIKNKAKSSVKKLAFDLINLQAKRKLKKSHAFSAPDHDFKDFSFSFKFTETRDQMRAIEDVLEDMQSDRPMDRLICGDVGFGKTEVAMRAAFLAVLDSKQVSILVPTTVLGLQHYHSFKERFKGFPVNIEFISRFKSAKQSQLIYEDLASGKIDILIGTHKLLSPKIKFKDLGLMIVDEEQRFGVGHKEKLKLMRESVDTLTLTATPIPRTLQLSFLGIKELSLIKTPPLRRQSIKTYVIKEDKQTIKNALEKELARGGQIFIVHNKVHDIEIFTGKIRELVPKARIIFAHGQLTPTELEKRISDFYSHKYDILVSTTIIESGIDIPNANTMIIDRADTYGLSQLHQLRGRIGRSDKKAYAYFMVPTHRKLSDLATKRLKALQTYAELGSGFSLATSDLEIRGSGDILGAEQSGHLANIGLELYMELLQEAIHELKGDKELHFDDIEIISNFQAYIPESYIEDSSKRIKYYKKLSNRKEVEKINETAEEITDQFGQLPLETKHLLLLLKSRIHLQGFGITKIKIQSLSIIVYFDQSYINNHPELQARIVKFFMHRPKVYKINPDFSINCKFKEKIEINDYYDFIKNIAQHI